jgi:hypothetical protein
MADPTPHWDQTDWGNLTLGSGQLPGKWEVEGEAARSIDIKKGKGVDGARVRDHGYTNAEITLVGRIATKEDFDKLKAALKQIHPRRKGAARDPLTVVHPALDTLGVNAVYVTAIDAPKLGQDGIVETRIKCLEWLPQPKPTKKHQQKPLGPGFTNEAFKGRGDIIVLDNGQEKLDLGIPPPRDSALAFLEPNRIAP